MIENLSPCWTRSTILAVFLGSMCTWVSRFTEDTTNVLPFLGRRFGRTKIGFFRPRGDSETERPAVLFILTGKF